MKAWEHEKEMLLHQLHDLAYDLSKHATIICGDDLPAVNDEQACRLREALPNIRRAIDLLYPITHE